MTRLRLWASRAGLVALVVGVLVVVAPSAALACSCAGGSVAQQIERADTIAVGTVEWKTDNALGRSYGVEVDEVYDGVATRQTKIYTESNEAACGLTDLAVGQRYLFFLQGKNPGQLRANLCGGTTSADDVAVLNEVQKRTDGPFEPFPFMAEPDPTAADGADVVRLAGVLSILGLIGFGAFALIRRRRQGFRGW